MYGYLIPPTEEGGADTFTPFKSSMYDKIIGEYKSSDVAIKYTYTATTAMTVIAFACSGCGGGAGWPLNQSNHYGYARIETDGVILASIIKTAKSDGYSTIFSTYCDVIQLSEGQKVSLTNNAYNNGNNVRMIVRIA